MSISDATTVDPVTIWTVGHSNVALDVLVNRLLAHQIALVADVRRFPASRRHPQFGQAALSAALGEAGIGYLHLADLGGRRQPKPESRNSAWRNDAFRGYADYMETPAFVAGIERLLREARQRRTAIMCAELLWWQCHRALIADYLKAANHIVLHITAAGIAEHPYTSAATIVDGRLSYAGRDLFE
jgi:uncharacterized protein (DUF488 family)